MHHDIRVPDIIPFTILMVPLVSSTSKTVSAINIIPVFVNQANLSTFQKKREPDSMTEVDLTCTTLNGHVLS